ncbi:MAG: DUF4340 domain-containing protein [Desulfamplus sp.]|nr:DUF4340 domain-containing protein [Desulfamplus sp.]
MKKEYIILGLIIVALSAYLVLHKKDRNNYILPLIPEINAADITEISIEKDGNSILLSKKDGTWFVTDKNYPASQESVTQILDIVKDLKLSALVSESGNLNPYELDSKNRISVTVKSAVETLRKFEIGKTAPSFRHTFVRLDGNSNVYHAAKSFRRDFDKTVDDLRDKKVLSFDKSKISSIALKKGETIKEIAIRDGKPVSVDAKVQDSAQGKEDSPAKEDKPVNSGSDNSSNEAKPVDSTSDKSSEEKADKPVEKSDVIESILAMLSDFKCHKFTDTDNKDQFKGMEEIASIVLQGEKEISLVIYKKDAQDNYPALSSENVYPFLLDTYHGDDIISKLDNVLGLKKEDENSNPVPE